jgi:hypothetical protein
VNPPPKVSLSQNCTPKHTFKTNHGGIQFLYRRTLDLDWQLFGKKRIRPPKQRRLPVALPDGEVRALLGCVGNPVHRTCLSLMYGCGLRIGEAVMINRAGSARMLPIGAIRTRTPGGPICPNGLEITHLETEDASRR